MAKRRKPSPNTHGRSEIWTRPSVVRRITVEQRKLARRLRSIRKEKGLSQDRAAELIGLHAKYLQRLESGSVNPTLATLVAIAHGYKTTLAEILGNK